MRYGVIAVAVHWRKVIFSKLAETMFIHSMQLTEDVKTLVCAFQSLN
jgi:hypothetical protein